MRRFFSLVFSVFLHFIPNALSEMNQIWIVSSTCLDGATLKILVLRVLWLAHKIGSQTDRQTDGHGDIISVFFLMKKALTIMCVVQDTIEVRLYSLSIGAQISLQNGLKSWIAIGDLKWKAKETETYFGFHLFQLFDLNHVSYQWY